MIKRNVSIIAVAIFALLLSACSVDLELDVQVKVDGKPVEAAKIVVDGEPLGVTDKDGKFSHVLSRGSEDEVSIDVSGERDGYRTSPWKNKFIVHERKDSKVMDKYAFTAELDFNKRYITIEAEQDGKPVAEATVKIGKKKVGQTDAQGVYVHEYDKMPKRGFNITVSKGGLTNFRKMGKLSEGTHLKAELYKQPVVSVTARTEAYGYSQTLSGVDVYFDKKRMGKTKKDGSFTYYSKEKPGRKVRVSFAKKGNVSAGSQTITLKGKRNISAYLYPTASAPIRIAVLPFASNTPGIFLADGIKEAEKAFNKYFFKEGSFVAVEKSEFDKAMKRSRMSVKKMTTKGWNQTSMRSSVDMVLLGSMSQDADGSIAVEGKIYNSNGELLMSHIAKESKVNNADDAGEEVGINLAENFPFEARVISTQDGLAKINMGTNRFDLGRREGFELSSTKYNKHGRVSAYSVIAQGDMNDRENEYSMIKLSGKKLKSVVNGTRVVRVSEEDARSKNTLIILAKGGVDDDVSPLAGVNVYLGDRWAGVTDLKGQATLKVRQGKSYDVIVYKHGYQKAGSEVDVKSGTTKQDYVLKANNSMFTVESSPPGADVFVDEELVGKTPVTKAIPITLGFHKVRVALGKEYRDWEDIVEFSGKTKELTGNNQIKIFKDFLRIGDAAESNNKIDDAIAAYSNANEKHPDYAEIRNRLAQLYLDDKHDYDAAIREFNLVVSLPEVKQLVLKQYAIVYTNLGNAQYEKGNQLLAGDKRAASKHFAKAVKSLDKAKGNVRFFPTETYDNAVHDTYYYSALAYHKLYEITKNKAVLDKADQAWQEYFDFYPEKFAEQAEYLQIKKAAQRMWDQLAEQM